MKKKHKEPLVPVERRDTLRREIISLLENRVYSAKEISACTAISEKEVYEHLEHILRTRNRRERNLIVTPAACKKCGFMFKKRERLKKPGKCPVCRNEMITDPLFYKESQLTRVMQTLLKNLFNSMNLLKYLYSLYSLKYS